MVSTSTFDFPQQNTKLLEADQVSLVYSILPHSIRKRTSKLLSFRRTVAKQDTVASHRRVPSDETVVSISPPPAYRASSDDSDHGSDERQALCSQSPSSPSSPGVIMSTETNGLRTRQGSESRALVPFSASRSTDRVAWKYMTEGFELISRSAKEAASPSQDPVLTRRLYIDGVAYFLRGLPTDLTAEERIRIGVAVPPQPDSSFVPQSLLAMGPATSEESTAEGAKTIRFSSLRPFVAKLTVCIVLCLKLVMYYLGIVMRKLYRYDRRHHISDRAIVQCVLLLDRTWRLMASTINRVCSMNDGQVGLFLAELLRCFADEVSNGLHDGLGEVFQKRETKSAMARELSDDRDSDSSN